MKKILIVMFLSLLAFSSCVAVSADNNAEVYFDTQVARRVVGETLELNLIGGDSLSFSSENETVATVDANGVVTACGAGDTYIIAKSAEGDARCHIFVTETVIEPVPFVKKGRAVPNVTVACLGDSITAYSYDVAPDDSAILRGFNYHNYWANEYMVKNHNYGLGWSMVSNAPHPAPDPENYPSFIKRLPKLINGVPNADLITVMGGVNDFSRVNLDDISSRDLETFTGALRHIIENLIEAYPDKQIVIFSPTRSGTGAVEAKNPFGNTKFDYEDRIVELADIYGVKAVRIYSVDELDMRSNFDLIAKDNVHPNKNGQKLLADYMFNAMVEIGAVSPIRRGSGFADTLSHWACDNIDQVVYKGLFEGETARRFRPDNKMTRAMLATVLSRLAGDTANDSAVPYKDLSEGAWYLPGVSFAYASNIVDGGDSFRPDDNVTREELADMLYRFAKYSGKNISTSELNFEDNADISENMRDGVAYCVNAKIINGYDNGKYFKAKNEATRAEVATMIMRFVNAE